MDECFAYDDVLRKKGHFVGGEALQSAGNATTLRWKNGKDDEKNHSCRLKETR